MTSIGDPREDGTFAGMHLTPFTPADCERWKIPVWWAGKRMTTLRLWTILENLK